jgi:hypothetical protein
MLWRYLLDVPEDKPEPRSPSQSTDSRPVHQAWRAARFASRGAANGTGISRDGPQMAHQFMADRMDFLS